MYWPRMLDVIWRRARHRLARGVWISFAEETVKSYSLIVYLAQQAYPSSVAPNQPLSTVERVV